MSVTPCLLRRLLGGLLLLTGLGLAACKDDPFRLGVVFPEADGLKPGDNVLMRGLQVGQVRDVDLHAEGVVAKLEIDPKFRRHIDGKATFTIDSEKLVTGKKALVITPGDPPGGALKNGAIVQGAASESDPIVRAKKALDDTVEHARDEASTLGRAITAPHTLPPRTAGDTVDLDPPGRFVVRLLKVRVHDLTADGRDWDGPGAGDADLVAQVWVDKRQVLLTNVVEDVHTAEWIDATSQAFDIGPDTTVRVKVLDRDVGYDDEIGIVELKPTRGDARTGRLFRLAAGRVAELDLKLEVAPAPEATADAGQ